MVEDIIFPVISLLVITARRFLF